MFPVFCFPVFLFSCYYPRPLLFRESLHSRMALLSRKDLLPGWRSSPGRIYFPDGPWAFFALFFIFVPLFRQNSAGRKSYQEQLWALFSDFPVFVPFFGVSHPLFLRKRGTNFWKSPENAQNPPKIDDFLLIQPQKGVQISKNLCKTPNCQKQPTSQLPKAAYNSTVKSSCARLKSSCARL